MQRFHIESGRDIPEEIIEQAAASHQRIHIHPPRFRLLWEHPQLEDMCRLAKRKCNIIAT
jgi:hypothetical protein